MNEIFQKEVKDKRILIVKSHIENGFPLKWEEIFSIVPIYVISQEAEITYNVMAKRARNVRSLSFAELERLAKAFEVTIQQLVPICLDAMEQKAPKK